MKKASFWRLAAAYVVDVVLSRLTSLGGVIIVCIWIDHHPYFVNTDGGWVILLVAATMFTFEVLYFAVLDSLFGGALGKRLFRLQVVEKADNKKSFCKMFGSYFADFLLLKPCLAPVGIYFAYQGVFSHYPRGNNLMFVLGFIILVCLESLYFAVCETCFGCSLGKAIFKFRVCAKKEL